MKKWLSTILSLLFVFTIIPVGTVTANAETYGYYTYVISDGDATITKFNSAIGGDIVIPSEIGGYPVTRIARNAFSACTSITSVVVPDSVTNIGRGAFENCHNLSSITLPFIGGSASENTFLLYVFGADSYSDTRYMPDSLKTVIVTDVCDSICNNAFKNFSKLETIVLPDTIKSIGNNAFYGCGGITGINIPNGVTSIGVTAFSYCGRLEKVIIPDSVTTMGAYAFSSCIGLTDIVIGDGLNSIESAMFEGCTKLKNVTIGSGVTQINVYAFKECSSLEKIMIPYGVLSIGERAFEKTALKNVVVPDSVANIGKGAFDDCYNLSSITLPFIGGSASENTFLLYVFGAYSYSDTRYLPSSLKTVVLTDNCTTIDSNAFYKLSSLETIVLPHTITEVGTSAFYGCNNVKDVYYGGIKDEWDNIYISSYNNANLTKANRYNKIDINNISAQDFTLMKKALLYLDIAKTLVDVNNDGAANVLDYIMLQRMAV